MDHNDIRHKLSEFIDGSVTPNEKSAIEEHLKTCTACSDALAELRKTIEQVKQIEEVEAPAWMTQKIMANVRAEAEEKKSFFHRLFYPLAVKLPIQAVGVLFLTITVYYIYSSMHPAEKYTEAPIDRLAKQEAPADGKDAAKHKASESAEQREKKIAQGPGYKSLDMKYEYEKPAPPAPAAPGAGVITARDESAASAPAKRVEQFSSTQEERAMENRVMARKAVAPSMMAEQAAPRAGASLSAGSGKKEPPLPTDRSHEEAEEINAVTEHFVHTDLPAAMKVKGLRFITYKYHEDLPGLQWIKETRAIKRNPCNNRYLVDVDLSGRHSKYLYCYDNSQIKLLGVYKLINDVWTEKH